MATETSSGSFDSALSGLVRQDSSRRSAQDDSLYKVRSRYLKFGHDQHHCAAESEKATDAEHSSGIQNFSFDFLLYYV